MIVHNTTVLVERDDKVQYEAAAACVSISSQSQVGSVVLRGHRQHAKHTPTHARRQAKGVRRRRRERRKGTGQCTPLAAALLTLREAPKRKGQGKGRRNGPPRGRDANKKNITANRVHGSGPPFRTQRPRREGRDPRKPLPGGGRGHETPARRDGAIKTGFQAGVSMFVYAILQYGMPTTLPSKPRHSAPTERP